MTTLDTYQLSSLFPREGPREPGEEEDDDDENITGDEDLYDSIENESPADEEDVLQEQEDELGEDSADSFEEDDFSEE